MHLRLPSSRLGCLLLTYALRDWTRRQELHLREVALQATAYKLLGHGVMVGVTGWACTSYRGVTARWLSTSPSATTWLVPLVRFERTNFSF